MITYSINDTYSTIDRFKIFALRCKQNELAENIAWVNSQKINVVNIGFELAKFIDNLDDYCYLNIDVYDYCMKILNNNKTRINGGVNDVVCIYNLGILLETRLELNAVHLFNEFSKSTSLIIIWEHQSEIPNRLDWPSEKNTYYFDFTESQIKNIQHAI